MHSDRESSTLSNYIVKFLRELYLLVKQDQNYENMAFFTIFFSYYRGIPTFIHTFHNLKEILTLNS